MSTCSVTGCGRKVIAKGLCGGHYKRLSYGIPLDTPLRRNIPNSTCTVDGCDGKHLANGLCSMHLSRRRNGTPMDQPVRIVMKEASLSERLRAYAPEGRPDDCWEWTRATTKGYGAISVGSGKLRGAHIVAWELANGRALPDGMQIRHTCDNPPCTNPAHLVLGTQADNMQDKSERDRWKPRKTKFRHRTPEEVRAIKSEAAEGISLNEIARRHNCSRATVGRIVNGEQFRDDGRRVSGVAKLTADNVREIRRLHADGISQQKIANRFGITQTAVSAILCGKTWKHIT